MFQKLRYLFLLFVLIQCKSPKSDAIESENSVKNLEFKYIQNIKCEESSNNFIISYNSGKKTTIPKEKLPITSCFVMNTSGIAYLNYLDLLNKITGVASPSYIYNEIIQSELKSNKIIEVGDDLSWDFEKMISSDTRFVFCNYNATLENIYHQLEDQGFYIIYLDEYNESIPLARTEYLKLMGSLFDKSELANSKFDEIEKFYKTFENQAQNQRVHPKVLTKIIYGDIWYMPEGNSYSAQLYKDAGANYPWSTTNGSGSLNLSFEEVFEKANDAPIWIDVSDIESKSQLLALNSNYQNFTSFKSGNIFALSGRKRGLANDFYESGVIHCEKVLKELNYIFRNYENIHSDSLFYYKKLN